MTSPRRWPAVISIGLMACTRAAAEVAVPPEPLDPARFTVDSSRVEAIASGIAHRYYWMREGPWAVHVIDIDRMAACWTLEAAKGSASALGRTQVSEILSRRASTEARGTVVAAVNADFFLFAPPGVPVGAHVHEGRIVTGPVPRPALIIDAAGGIAIDTLSSPGWLTLPSYATEIVGWNRPLAGALSLMDERWGARTDTSTGAVEVVVSGHPRGVVVAVDTLPSGVDVPTDGIVLVAGRAAPLLVRQRLAALRPGVDSVTATVSIAPIPPRDAVGGFPILVRAGIEVAGLDSAGGVRFGPVRHPRTAVGIARDGARIFLVVVDGRQAPYSDGMTLRELARLMIALGANEAINLDGGGSTAMAVTGRRGVRVVNRPSDEQGERAVGNALVVAQGKC